MAKNSSSSFSIFDGLNSSSITASFTTKDNKSQIGNETYYSHEPTLDTGQMIEIVYQSLVILIGFPINVWAAERHWRLFRQTGISQRQEGRLARMSVNLIIGNLLIHLHCLMKTIWLYTYFWYGGDILCRAYQWNSFFCFHLSSNMVAAISIDMYYCIKSPLKAAVNGRKFVRRLVIGAYVSAALLSVPQLFMKGLIFPEVFEGRGQCYLLYHRQEYQILQLVYASYHSITVFYIPLGVIISCYACIGNTIKDRLNERKTMTTAVNNQKSLISNNINSSEKVKQEGRTIDSSNSADGKIVMETSGTSGEPIIRKRSRVEQLRQEEHRISSALKTPKKLVQMTTAASPRRGSAISQALTGGVSANSFATYSTNRCSSSASDNGTLINDGRRVESPGKVHSHHKSKRGSMASIRTSFGNSLSLLASLPGGPSSEGADVRNGKPPLIRKHSKGVIMKKRFLKISLAIIFTYVVTWLPYQALFICKQICSASRRTLLTCATTLSQLEWLEAFMLLSTCINPFLYQFKLKRNNTSSGRTGRSRTSQANNSSAVFYQNNNINQNCIRKGPFQFEGSSTATVTTGSHKNNTTTTNHHQSFTNDYSDPPIPAVD